MVNHTIHTCEQRVRFPLSAIVIFIHYISTILYSTPHIHKHKPTHIYSLAPPQTKPHHHYYYISVSILHSYKPNYIFIFSYHTHHYFLTKYIYIYILSYLLLINNMYIILLYIYQLTIKIHHYLRYISYIYNYYLLTYTEKQNPPIYSLISPYNCIYTYPYLHTVYTIYTITTSSLLLHHIVNILYVYMYIYTYIHTIISIVFILI